MQTAGPVSASRFSTYSKVPCRNGRDKMQEVAAVPQHTLYATPANAQRSHTKRAPRIALTLGHIKK